MTEQPPCAPEKDETNKPTNHSSAPSFLHSQTGFAVKHRKVVVLKGLDGLRVTNTLCSNAS